MAASVTPAANVNAASTPSTPTTAPIRAGRTGTDDRPRPGSSANWEPMTTATGRPAPEAAAAATDRRVALSARRPVSARAARAAAVPSTSSGTRTQPVPSTSQSALIPGWGSTAAAAPIGIHCEATMAAATPMVAPASAARAGAAAAAAAPCRRVSPTDCRICRSAVVLDT